MGFYADQVLPRFVDKALGGAPFEKLRKRVTAPLSGEVLEIGFGSGRNVPYYGDAVTRVRAVDPAVVGRKLAAARVEERGIPVEYIGLDGERLPIEDESVDHVLTTWTLCTIPDVRQALTEARAHKGLWLLTGGFFVCGFQIVFIGVHLPAYLLDRQMPPQVGVWALALIGFFNIIGTVGSGWLGGFMRKKKVLATIYLLRAVAISLFLLAPLTPLSVYLFAAAFGILWLSTVPLTNGLVAQIFGVRYLAMLSGIVFFGHQVGSFFGAYLGGYLFDRTGSYDIVWMIGIGLSFVAAALNWPIDDQAIERVQPLAQAA